MTLSPEEVRKICFEILTQREDLDSFEREISFLLQSCTDRHQVDLIRHMLSRLCIVDFGDLPSKVDQIAEHVKALAEDGENIAVVAMAYDGSADGSQTIVQLLKPRMAKVKNCKIFNSVPSYMRNGGIDTYKRYVLVDDFTGSGQTVLNRVKEISSNAKGRGILVESYVCLLFGMDNALSVIQDAVQEVRIFETFPAGISGYFSGDQLDLYRKAMIRLEGGLKSEIEGKHYPSFGYNQAEAMFCIRDANAPNSNFPIFWWPMDASGNERSTIMVRAEL